MAEGKGQFLRSQGKLPRLIFVTGGPGTGKGTQCANLVEHNGFKHISIGDLVRAEIKSRSEVGQSIESIVKSGNLVPKELVVDLLAQALLKTKAHTLLVDGFPRDMQQAVYLEQLGIRIDYILHYEADSDDTLLNRLLERGRTSGRADDNEETIIHRFQVYKSESIPVLSLYDPFNIIHRVNCMGSIHEVYLRTIRTLRPELVCVMGPLSSGKTTVAKEICRKYDLEYLDFTEVKVNTRNEDEEVQALMRKLTSYKNQYRVLVDGFPETLGQARLFASLSGDPDYVIYLHCAKDVCQERILKLGVGAKGYLPSAEISRRYQSFAAEAKGLGTYYRKSLGANFKDIDGGNENKFLVQSQAYSFIEPEVVLIRGEIIPSFLEYVRDKLGFRLVNTANILRLWRQARALSSPEDSSSSSPLADDPELIPILKSLIYSGTKGRKFALYNFALTSFPLFSAFDMNIASISKAYFLYRNQGSSDQKLTTGYFNLPKMQENITEHLFCTHKATAIPIDGLHPYAPMVVSDSEYFSKVLTEQSTTSSGHIVFIYGPKLSGKTTLAKLLTTLFGFQLMDFNAVIEETKAALSTEEEPKEAVNFTELCEGVKRFLEKRVGQTFVVDGLPDMEILTLPGGKNFKDLELPEGGEGEVALDEDPSVIQKMTLISERWESLFRNYLQSASHSVLQVSTPQETLVKRGRKAAELTDEDETPAELLTEIQESEMWGYYLGQRKYFPGVLDQYHRHVVPGSVAAETKAMAELVFTRRLILFKNHYLFGTTDVVKRLCYTYRMCYLNFFSICDQTMRSDTPLAQRLKQAKVTQTYLPFALKIEVLTTFVQKHVPVRCKFVVLTNYEFTKDGEFPSCFDELAALEKVIGKLHAFVNVTLPEHVENGQMEDLPVRIRKRVKQPGEEDEEEAKKDAGEEEAEGAEVQAAVAQPEEPEVTPMWNNYEPSNLTLTFQHYKGMPAKFVQIQAKAGSIVSELESQLELVVKNLETRWNVQYIVGKKLGGALTDAIEQAKKELVGSIEFYEKLPLDISELGNYSQKMERLLTNPRAREFHKKYLKQMTVPFATFFHYFSQTLESAGIKATPGLRKAIGSVIDTNRNSHVSADELSQFFDMWESESRKQQILRDGQSRDAEAKSREQIGYQLVLVAASVEPDPLTGACTFAVGDTIEIAGDGCPASKRYCMDGVTIFGKENRVVQNDVMFDPADTRIKNHHFSVLSVSIGYFVTDAGSQDGVRVLLEDTPLLLRQNLILQFNSSDKCYVRTCAVQSSVRHSSEPFLDRFESLGATEAQVTISENPVLEFEFIAGFHYGRRIALKVGEKRRFLVGSGTDCDVYLPDAPALLQAWIEYGESGWTLLDMHSSAETWVFVNSYDRIVAEKPSLPVKIRNGVKLAIPGTTFKAIYKQSSNVDLSLSISPVVRRMRFRDVYTINRRLGKGAYDSVFQCTHKGSKVRFAVKMIEKAKIDGQLIGQLEVLRTYDHPGVCSVMDIVEEARTVYVVAELTQGEDVMTPLTRRDGITEETVAVLLREMSSALSYLHSKGLAHLSLSPDYFRHTADASSPLKLLDFATARLLLPQYRAAERVAAHHFVAPEIMKNKGDAKSDIWALGATLYIMFCGQPPYPGRTEQEVAEKIKAGKPTFKEVGWKKVSKTARRLIGLMMSAAPAQRPTAQEVLNHSWTQQRSKSVNYSKTLAEKAFKNLKGYGAASTLQQALLQYITNTQLTEQERNSINSWFAEVDTDGSGFVSTSELKNGFVGAGLEISDEEVETLISRLDSNHTGMLNYSEFLTALVSRTILLAKDRLNAIFASLDADASGDLTTAELKSVLGQTDGVWQRLLEQIDSNKDGKIDAREFKDLVLGLQS